MASQRTMPPIASTSFRQRDVRPVNPLPEIDTATHAGIAFLYCTTDKQDLPPTPRHDQLELFAPDQVVSPRFKRRRQHRYQREGNLGWLATSWKAFSLGGLPVRFHFSCLIYPVGYLAWLNREVGWWRNAIEVAVIVLLFWGSLLAHECAHIVAARWQGVGTQGITVLPVGAMAHLDSMPRGAGEFWIALAGPVGSFLLAAIFWLLHLIVPVSPETWLIELARLSRLTVIANLAMAVFNLLPCFPMDGGRMFRALLAITLAKWFRGRRDEMHLLASRIAVRYVVPVMVLEAIVITITCTHIWIHLILFPLLWLAAELEYQVAREAG